MYISSRSYDVVFFIYDLPVDILMFVKMYDLYDI